MLISTPEFSPMRPGILRALSRAGCCEAIDVSFLTDEDIAGIGASEEMRNFLAQARARSATGKSSWIGGFARRWDTAPLQQPVPRTLDYQATAPVTRGGERAEAALRGLAMAASAANQNLCNWRHEPRFAIASLLSKVVTYI